MREITAKQRDLLTFIQKYLKEKKEHPTFFEMSQALGVSETAVYDRVKALEAKGYLTRESKWTILKTI